MKSVPIGDLVERSRQCDPRELGRDRFTYIDISSVDREAKRIVSAQCLSTSQAPSRARKQVRAGDVILSTVRPNLNAVALVQPQFDGEIASTGFAVLRAKSTALDPRYLFYFLQTERLVSQLTRIANGASYPAISDDDALHTPIPLPDLAEQKRIAAILERADQLRRLRRYGLEMATNFVEPVFLTEFGNPGSRDFRIEKVPLSAICKLITDGTHRTPTYLQTGVAFLSVKNVNTPSGEIDFDDVKYISRQEHQELIKRCKPECGDILYTKVGATFGIPKLVKSKREFSIFVSLALIKPDTSKVLPEYLEAVLATNFVFRQAQERVSGIAVPDLHLVEIREFMIPLPPVAVQKRFVGLLQQHERIKAIHRESLRQGEHLFQTLLHRAFTVGL